MAGERTAASRPPPASRRSRPARPAAARPRRRRLPRAQSPAARPDAARPDAAPPRRRAAGAPLEPPPMATRPPVAAVGRRPGPVVDCAAASAGRAAGTGPTPPEARTNSVSTDADEGGGQQRRPRMQPEGRHGEPESPPHPVKQECDNKLRQRELGTAAPARLLPETADHRPSLPAGQAGQQVDRDPSRQTFGDALKPGHVVRSRHEVATANADHGCAHSRRSIHTRTPKNHTGSPRRRISSTEYNATVCHVHGN